MQSTYTNLGPGDEATWPAPCGHSNDPRNDFDDDHGCTPEEEARMADESAYESELGRELDERSERRGR